MEIPAELPGQGGQWVKLKGRAGWRDGKGMIWRKDQLHKDHWDVMDPRTGKKTKEVDFEGRQIWPHGPKQRGKEPK